jgi:hypothetical protein
LEGSKWNRKAAAYDLQISYKALLYKIKQYNLTPPPKQYGPQSDTKRLTRFADGGNSSEAENYA